ncbi:MAG: hypothetical protein JO316_23910 [Abitibacteriaceae bacterium]|nr:hypothetical protein [Abditibacteriaceae bacterium]MBV9868411.1 hypothetical protein [Abditibacteriaceae bacterium]
MTLTIELPIELEEQLQTQAEQLGMEPTDIALDALTVYLATSTKLLQRAGRINRLDQSEPLTLVVPTGEGKTLAALDAISAYQTRTGLAPLDDTSRSAESDIYGYSEREDVQL